MRFREVVDLEKSNIARLGADKFILYSYNLKGTEDIVGYIHRVERSFNKKFNIDHAEILLKASIGASIYPHDGTDSKALIASADLAMRRC